MTNRFLIFVFLCSSIAQIQAQSMVDSLENILSQTKVDTVRVNTYLHFFFTDLFYDQPDEVIAYSHKARVLGEQIGYAKGVVMAHNNLGYVYRTQSKNDSAFYHYRMGVKKAKPIDFFKGLTDAHIGIGNTHNQLGEWGKAVEQFNVVIGLAEAAGDTIQMASAYNNIGNTYLNQSKFEDALINYQKSAAMGDASIRGVALINMGVVHNQMGHLDEARSSFQNSLEDAQRLNKKGHLAFIYKNLGILEKKSGNYEQAIQYYTNALEHYQNLSDDFNSSEIIQNMGNVFFEQKEYTKALENYQRSLALQEKIKYPVGICYNQLYLAIVNNKVGNVDEAKDLLQKVGRCADTLNLLSANADATELMSIILQKEGQYQEALQYHRAFKKWSDSAKAVNSEEKIAELETKYQTTQKENDIKLLSKENEVANLQIEKQNNTRNFLIVAAIILLILALALYSRYSIKTKAANKLRELDALKNRFYTNISHEFRTPLTLILNPLDKILKKGNSGSDSPEILVAHRNAERLLQLTNQMLDLSKLEAGKLKLQVAPTNIKELLTLISASFESLAQSKDIAFTTALNLENRMGYLDSDKIQKILNNLLSNAFKFTPSGGSVHLNANCKGDKLSLLVTDTGDGLSDTEREQIFDRFHQASNVQEQGGTGIGLTLTKELVLLHKGTINLDSKKGLGSTFKIQVPIDKDFYSKHEIAETSSLKSHKRQAYPIPAQSNGSEIEVESPHMVLIVEDNEDLRVYIGNLLKTKYSVEFAINGKNGLEKAQKIIPDLIISDWMMPEMNGGELCEAIKNDERTSHIPFILLTAKADKDSKLDGFTIGADAYLSKPFDNEELLVRTENLIRQREMLQKKYAELLLVEPTKVSITDPDRQFMEKALECVNNHMVEADYTSEQFQKDMGMSRMQLHRKLKALVGQSASEFIRNLRLQRAADMLAQNKLQVSQVAYECGFNNLSYFGQCFKEKYGVPPSQYTTN